MDFQKMIGEERARLQKAIDGCSERKAVIDQEMAGYQREMKAIQAYEQVKTGKAPVTGKRRTGVRADVIAAIKAAPNGLPRADVLKALGAEEKSEKASISTALANLKKAGTLTQGDSGHYKAA